MSNIIVDYNAPIQDGTEVVFRSPVDCSQITGLKVNYIGGSQEFMLADAHGNNVGDIDHLFAENVVVKVILDVSSGMAFVQNPDTNSYLEYRFGMLADSIANEASGSTITLTDSSNRELQGLTLSGTDAETVTIKVTGKNIADSLRYSAKDMKTASATAVLSNSFGTTLSATSGDSIIVTQNQYPTASNPGSYNNGDICFGFYCPLRKGDRVTISFDYEITNNPLNITGTEFLIRVNTDYQAYMKMEGNKLYYTQYVNAEGAAAADGWNRVDFRNCGTSGVISNFQIEYGNTATDYEPYKGQTLVVTDLANIDYAQLHTYKPNTIITNDVGAEMSVEYVTDSTRVFIRMSGVNIDFLHFPLPPYECTAPRSSH